jgi:4-hydroxy-2-oxoglutarate aldolase
MAMALNLAGVFPPVTTPFLDTGDFSPHKLRANVEKWNRTSLTGYVATGSTGESVFLTQDEKYRVWETLRDAAAPGKLLIAGTAAESARETIELTNKAAEMGYKVALVRTPHYYKGQMSRAECQLTYYRAVADAAKIPVMIYNFPQATSLDVPADVIIKLSEHPNIIGIKESAGNLEKVAQMVNHTPAEFTVLVGSAPTLYPSLAVGAKGAILAFANAAPCSSIAIYDAWRNGDHSLALRAQRKIATAAAIVGPKYGIPGLKYAMDLNGYYGGPVRLPLIPLSPAAKTEIEEVFREVTE